MSEIDPERTVQITVKTYATHRIKISVLAETSSDQIKVNYGPIDAQWLQRSDLLDEPRQIATRRLHILSDGIG